MKDFRFDVSDIVRCKSCHKIITNTKYLILVFGLLFVIGCNSNVNNQEDKRSDLEKKGIRGSVKSREITEYEAIDKFGEIIKGSIIRKELENYNLKGNMIQYQTSSIYGDSEIYTTKYDERDNKIENVIYKNNSLQLKCNYRYDDKNNMIEACYYQSDNVLDRKIICKYDDKNNKIEENEYNKDGSLRSKTEYYIKDNEINMYKHNSNGDIVDAYYSKYDWKGNCIEKRIPFKLKEVYLITYKYDVRKNIIEEIRYDDRFNGLYTARGGTERVNYMYDDKNNLVVKQVNSTQITIWDYKYDNKGNYIEKIESEDITMRKVKKITEIKIEYYM